MFSSRLTSRVFRTTWRRTYASQSHGKVNGDGTEPIGYGFWCTVAVIPFAIAVYETSRPGPNSEEPFMTKQWHRFHHLQEQWAQRNAVHAEAIFQAGQDRLLFLTAPRNENYELRHPEIIENRARRNIVAGSQANLDKLYAHYQTQREEMAAIQAQNLAKEQERQKQLQ